MIRAAKAFSAVVIGMVVFGQAAAFAASPGEGLHGQDGQLLSSVITYAGSGEFSDQNGAAATASFRKPEGIAVGKDGTVYVSDSANQVIRSIADGKVSTYAGISLADDAAGLPQGTLLDGKADESAFHQPAQLDFDGKGNLYVADSANNAIRKITPDGQVTTLAGNGVQGFADGRGSAARFHDPQGIAVAQDGTVYVADTLNHVIRKVDTDGNVTTLNARSTRSVQVIPGLAVPAGDYKDGALATAEFNEPSGLALDAKGNLYVSDSGNQLIRYIDLQAETVATVAGSFNGTYPTADDEANGQTPLYAPAGDRDGKAAEASFHFPRGIAVTGEGGLVIADSLNHAVRYLYHDHVTTIAGNPDGAYGDTNGINGMNLLNHPMDVAVGPDDRIFIADSYNNKIRVFSVYQHPHSVKPDGSIHVVLNGKLVAFDVQPTMINNRTMVPVRAVGESFGYDVSEENGIITVANRDTSIRFELGRLSVTVVKQGQDPATRTIDAKPYEENGRVFVPLRFFSEPFGLDVQWDAATNTAILRDKTTN